MENKIFTSVQNDGLEPWICIIQVCGKNFRNDLMNNTHPLIAFELVLNEETKCQIVRALASEGMLLDTCVA